MRKEDMNTPALLMETMGILLGVIYIGLQIFYGVYYHVPPFKLILNLSIMLLFYAGLSLLSVYPERINQLPPELCVGKIRRYSLWMIRWIKFIFVASLLIPCVFDALGAEIQSVYSLIVIGAMLLVAVYCEYQIINELRNQKK